jgi:hypothetical protein
MIYLKLNGKYLLSPGACLREAASAKAGERIEVRGKENDHPHRNLPPQETVS